MWEIVENKRPYYGILSNAVVQQEVIAGLRLERITLKEDDPLWSMMVSCWLPASKRPSFAELIPVINSVLSEEGHASDEFISRTTQSDYHTAPFVEGLDY